MHPGMANFLGGAGWQIALFKHANIESLDLQLPRYGQLTVASGRKSTFHSITVGTCRIQPGPVCIEDGHEILFDSCNTSRVRIFRPAALLPVYSVWIEPEEMRCRNCAGSM
jgi:hypothetical protein